MPYLESLYSQEVWGTPQETVISPVSFSFTPGAPIKGEGVLTDHQGRSIRVQVEIPADALDSPADIILGLVEPDQWPEPAGYFNPSRNLAAIRLDVASGEELQAPVTVFVSASDLSLRRESLSLHARTHGSPPQWEPISFDREGDWIRFELGVA